MPCHRTDPHLAHPWPSDSVWHFCPGVAMDPETLQAMANLAAGGFVFEIIEEKPL